METNYEHMENLEKTDKQGSVVRGLIGGLVAALIAAIAWAAFGILTERVSAVVGFLVGFIVCYGYDLFKGRDGLPRSIIVFVCVVLAVVIGDLGYYAWNIHSGYNSEIGEIKELLASGTDAEIADWIFEGDAEGLAEYNSYSTVSKSLYIRSVKQQMQEYTSMTEAEYAQLVLSDPEFKTAVIKDGAMSIVFGLLGSFGLILSKKKKEQEAAKAASFDDARVGNVDAEVSATDFEVTESEQAEQAPAAETPAE